MKLLNFSLWIFLFCTLLSTPALAQSWKSKNQSTINTRDSLERRVENLEKKLETFRWENSFAFRFLRFLEGGALLFLFGTVASLWAQNTGRNPKKWFLLGAFLNVIAMIIILIQNARDKDLHQSPADTFVRKSANQ